MAVGVLSFLLVCFALGVFAEKGITNVINVGPDNVPYDSCAVSVGYNEDSRVEFFILGNDDEIYHRAQPKYTSPASEWSTWHSLGGIFRDGPVVIRDTKGRLMVFARGYENSVFFKSQLKFNGGAEDWGVWELLGGNLFSRPSVVLDSEGLIHVFGRAKDNTLLHRRQFANDTGIFWNDWKSLGGALSGAPTSIVDSEGLVHVYARSTDRSLLHLTQLPTKADGEEEDKAELMSWAPWKTMGGTLASNPRLPLLNNDANLLEVVVRGSDKAYWVKAQLSNHEDTVAWSKWGSLGGVFASGPAIVPTHDGLVDVFGRGVDKKVYGRHQQHTEEGVVWTEWTEYGGETTTAPEVARRPDGTLVLFARGKSGDISIRYQTIDPSDYSVSWSDWLSLGGNSRTFSC